MIISEPGRTHSNGFKLDKFRLNKDVGKNWLANRVVDAWNRPKQSCSERQHDRYIQEVREVLGWKQCGVLV